MFRIMDYYIEGEKQKDKETKTQFIVSIGLQVK